MKEQFETAELKQIADSLKAIMRDKDAYKLDLKNGGIIAAGSIILLVLLAIIAIILWCCCCRKSKKNKEKRSEKLKKN